MDEDWGEDTQSNGHNNFGGGGSDFSRGRGYSRETKNDDDWGSPSNDFGANNGFGYKPRRGGGRSGGRGFSRGGRGRGGGGDFGSRNDDNGFGSGGDHWGNGDGDPAGASDDFGGGRGSGRGRGRGGRPGRGGRGDDFGFGGDRIEGEERKPPKSTYEPEEANDDDLQNTGITTGINFGKYNDIPVVTSGENVPPPVKSLEEAHLREVVLSNVRKANYKKLTPIQQYSIPIIMAGRDLMACAQTGSGKTAAFLLPIINRLLEIQADLIVDGNWVSPQCVIMSPTRELTTQIYEQARKFAQTSVIKVGQVYGGTAVSFQRNKLIGGCHILVATPGRLLAFVRDGTINFSATRFIVLDEADRMLDMGFRDDITTVMSHQTMPEEKCQTLMYSATFPEDVQKFAGRFLNNYIFVCVGIVGGACSDIEQKVIEVGRYKKRDALLELLNTEGTEGTVVFVDTKRNADFLAICLSEQQMPTTSIHGDRPQPERESALRDFRRGRSHILVATEVAARGLDVQNIKHVINYDMPSDINQYVHRIGRTGRVGNRGKATTFFDIDQDYSMAGALANILKSAGQPVPDFIERASTGDGYAGGNGFGGDDIRGDGFGGSTALNEPEEEW